MKSDQLFVFSSLSCLLLDVIGVEISLLFFVVFLLNRRDRYCLFWFFPMVRLGVKGRAGGEYNKQMGIEL